MTPAALRRSAGALGNDGVRRHQYLALFDQCPAKRTDQTRVAIDLLDNQRCALSLQVLNEFVWQVSHARKPSRILVDEAVALTTLWRRFPIQPLDLALFDTADDVRRRTRYSWWDSLIVAAAIALGCDTLASEDMQHGRVIDSVRIVDPFRDAG